jgi:GNAT superfamily N-acetyltransferase
MVHLQFVLRNMTENDKPFIYNSFLKSFKENSDSTWVSNGLYYRGQTEVVDFLLSSCNVLIACFPEDPEEILAYTLYQVEKDVLVLHYIYTRRSFQKTGIAREIINSIIPASIIIATHITYQFAAFRYKLRPIKVVYDPYFIPKNVSCQLITMQLILFCARV